MKKPGHFKTLIAAKPEVVLMIQKHIWNRNFKFYNLFFVLIVAKILSSKLLAYKRSGGITWQYGPYGQIHHIHIWEGIHIFFNFSLKGIIAIQLQKGGGLKSTMQWGGGLKITISY